MLGFPDVYPLAFSVNRMVVISESSVLSKNITALTQLTYTTTAMLAELCIIQLVMLLGTSPNTVKLLYWPENPACVVCKYGDVCNDKSIYFASFG
jgi:hypothetical protein